MDPAVDLRLPGGWHITLFHVWAWAVLAVIVLLLVAAVLKRLTWSIRRGRSSG